jgi:hypothetical protein
MDRFQHERSGANFRTMSALDQAEIAAFRALNVACLFDCFRFKTIRHKMLHNPHSFGLPTGRRMVDVYRYNRGHF